MAFSSTSTFGIAFAAQGPALADVEIEFKDLFVDSKVLDPNSTLKYCHALIGSNK